MHRRHDPRLSAAAAQPMTVSSNALASQVDEIQYGRDEGPA
jgi:hypothetical protein